MAPSAPLTIEVRKGRVIRLDRPAAAVFVADPDTADVQVHSPSLIYLLGRTCEPTDIEVVRDGSGGGVAVLRAIGKSGNNDFINFKGIGIFPVDAETLRYLTQTGRPTELVALVEAYCKEQGLFHDANTPEAAYSDTLELDLATVEPSVAGPSRPQDRVALVDVKQSFAEALPKLTIRPSGDRQSSDSMKVSLPTPS